MPRPQRRARGRERRDRDPGIRTLPWQSVENPFPPLEPLSADQVEAIHEASMDLLENHGIEVMGDAALDSFARAGAMVDRGSGVVRLDRGLVAEAIAKAPSRFTLTPREPAHALELGGNRIHFGLVSGAPNLHDRINGRRAGNLQDYIRLVSLGQCFPCIHFLGSQPAPPIELPANSRHLDIARANLVHTDRIFHAIGIGAGRVADAVEMVARARGMSAEDLENDPSVITNLNINSPRKLDEAMAEGLMESARRNQATIVTPFTLMGAMTPVTLAAALTQQNAEALLGLTLVQLTRPGAPMVYGGFTSNVDMKTGAPAFGTPENAKANLAGGQLARRYGLPYRTSDCNAANTVDAQATWETMMALWGAVMGHGNLIYHGAGWLEGGLVASFEKLVVDAEILQHIISFLKPIDTSPAEIATEAIAAVAPGGHFFGTEHTMARYETAFYAPFLSDWRTQENWREDGAKTATERATGVWQRLLAEYEPPPMDPGRLEAIDAYVAKRKETLGTEEP
ncbi:trimethylamine methyltransferase family protein [Marivibrio halodurans]|uniref:Methyltransferase n=1 Tax=Marivibrio halodurans TaxID=2039722 RepID=A0A8J7V134_9PROT|nr:trimethylamine methyltransferase family protein [Marivibrio halodurans]MBP5857386.1 trimethylamine methyltransferase family protein [Marivibrio halodurans]